MVLNYKANYDFEQKWLKVGQDSISTKCVKIKKKLFSCNNNAQLTSAIKYINRIRRDYIAKT